MIKINEGIHTVQDGLHDIIYNVFEDLKKIRTQKYLFFLFNIGLKTIFFYWEMDIR